MQFGIAYKNPCARHGPVPAEAFDRLNGGIVTEERSLWPIGSVCVWARADPDGQVTYGLAAGGLVSFISGVIPASVYARDRRSSQTK